MKCIIAVITLPSRGLVTKLVPGSLFAWPGGVQRGRGEGSCVLPVELVTLGVAWDGLAPGFLDSGEDGGKDGPNGRDPWPAGEMLGQWG